MAARRSGPPCGARALSTAAVAVPRRRWTVLLATVVLVCAGLRLGVWQMQRAHQKEALQTAIDSRALLPPLAQADLARTPADAAGQHYRRTLLRGRWLAAATVYLDNRQIAGRPGFFVVTPLVWNGGAVAVQRGWVARDNDVRSRLPALDTPAGEVEVHGRIAPPPARLYEFSGAASGPIRQNLDLAGYAREAGVALLPLSVLQDDAPGTAPDGLLRRWPRPAVDVQKHYGYAFQWFALAALTAGLHVWFRFLRPRRRRALRHQG